MNPVHRPHGIERCRQSLRCQPQNSSYQVLHFRFEQPVFIYFTRKLCELRPPLLTLELFL